MTERMLESWDADLSVDADFVAAVVHAKRSRRSNYVVLSPVGGPSCECGVEYRARNGLVATMKTRYKPPKEAGRVCAHCHLRMDPARYLLYTQCTKAMPLLMRAIQAATDAGDADDAMEVDPAPAPAPAPQVAAPPPPQAAQWGMRLQVAQVPSPDVAALLQSPDLRQHVFSQSPETRALLATWAPATPQSQFNTYAQRALGLLPGGKPGGRVFACIEQPPGAVGEDDVFMLSLPPSPVAEHTFLVVSGSVNLTVGGIMHMHGRGSGVTVWLAGPRGAAPPPWRIAMPTLSIPPGWVALVDVANDDPLDGRTVSFAWAVPRQGHGPGAFVYLHTTATARIPVAPSPVTLMPLVGGSASPQLLLRSSDSNEGAIAQLKGQFHVDVDNRPTVANLQDVAREWRYQASDSADKSRVQFQFFLPSGECVRPSHHVKHVSATRQEFRLRYRDLLFSVFTPWLKGSRPFVVALDPSPPAAFLDVFRGSYVNLMPGAREAQARAALEYAGAIEVDGFLVRDMETKIDSSAYNAALPNLRVIAST